MQSDELRETSRLRAQVFNHVSAYVAAVPTYVGGFMALGIASDRPIAAIPVAELTVRASDSGILGLTGYWSPEVHAAAFALPPYVSRSLPAMTAAEDTLPARG
jgi:spermidine synthase